MPDRITRNKNRSATVNFVVIAASLTAGAAGLVNLILYFQVFAWQMLFMAIAEALTVLGILYVGKLADDNKMESAGFLILALTFLGFGSGELVHQGLTIVLAIGGALILVYMGITFMPRRFSSWLPITLLYLAYIWAVNEYEPLPRYNIQTLMTFRVIIVLVIIFALSIAIWQFVRVLRFGKIRTRLLTAIVSMATIPALAIITAVTLLSVQRSIEQTQYQLGSVADLKTNEVEAWFVSLQTNLRLAVPSSDQVGFTEMLLKEPQQAELEFYRVIYEREKTRYQLVLDQSRVFEEIFLLDLSGRIIISTDSSHEGDNEYGYTYFNLGLEKSGATTPFRYPYNDELTIMTVAPVQNTSGEQIAILAARANLASLDEIMLERAGLGQQGVAYLMATKTLQLLTQLSTGGSHVGDYIYSRGISSAAERGVNGEARYENPWGVQVIGAYRTLPDVGMILLSEQPESEALRPVYQNVLINIALTVSAVILAVLIALGVTGRITSPIADLATTAEKISAGDLELVAEIEAADEIGALATAFNSMTAQLRKILSGLEQQVKERTAALEQRTSYLQASAEVSRAVGSVLDPDQLIKQVVQLIRERFDLYYVGLFLLDSQKQYAVLRAGTGTAGQSMLARHHRIKVGSGMVGWCVANRAPRIAQRADLDASRLANPDLPDTRSEAAIPLISRGEVLGALTIQSTQQDVFDPATISVFETMADQVAVALDNANLFAQSQQSLESLRSVYGQITIEGWRKLLDENPQLGYRSEIGAPLSQDIGWSPELVTTYRMGQTNHGKAGDGSYTQKLNSTNQLEDSYYLGIPLKVREQVIGVLGCYKSISRGEWSQEEISFMEDVSQTVSNALDSARFFNETQLRAENERLIADVTGQLRQTLDIDTVLTTAVREIQRILNLAEVEIRVANEV